MRIFKKRCRLALHEMLQSYLDKVYSEFDSEINQSMYGQSDEIYGELYYYSAVKLLNFLKLTEKDIFLDVGSGLGRLIFQFFFLTDARSVVGIEINKRRYEVSCKVKEKIQQQLPDLFQEKRDLNIIHGDFLKYYFHDVTVVYICSTVFSFELLTAIGERINLMQSVQKVISLRKIPNLSLFEMHQKIFLQGTWDNSPCYLYIRKK